MADVYLTRRDGNETLMRTIPEGKYHEAFTVATEMAEIAKRAYEMGAADATNTLERELIKVLHNFARN